MSKLEELIERLCPDGVEFCKLKDVAEIGTGSSDRKNATDDGLYPFYVRSKDVLKINNYEFDEEAIVIPGEGGIGEIFHLVKGKYALHQRAYRIHLKNKNILTSFLYYYMKSNFKTFINKKAVSATVTSIRKPMIEEFKLPVPPLEVQREIVRILDNFTFLTTELAAELAARQKQYEYYRDLLLTFKPNESTILNERTNELELSGAIRWMKLGNICLHSYSGATPKKSNSEYYTNGTIPWIRTQDVVFNNIYKVDAYITEKAVQETGAKWIPENCVIVAISGASAGRCAINKIKATTNQHCLNMEIDSSKALYKYVFYCLCNQEEELILKKQGARGDLNSSIILGMKIPIPPLEQQQRIVGILDRFDTLCNDITSGLPAEIEIRQKQYEYYRDKLLTFKELKKEA